MSRILEDLINKNGAVNPFYDPEKYGLRSYPVLGAKVSAFLLRNFNFFVVLLSM